MTKFRKHPTPPLVLRETQAALIFGPDGLSLLVPQNGTNPPHIQLAIAMAMRLQDPQWVHEISRWADEMQQLGSVHHVHWQ